MIGAGAVLAESNRGFTPTEIDERLGLRRGDARRMMVGIWREDNETAALARESRRKGANGEGAA